MIVIEVLLPVEGIISSDDGIDKEVDSRLAKANNTFGMQDKRVSNNNNLTIKTKICVYRAVVLRNHSIRI